ncbi:MAG: TlpA disulfide reductase family protein, partial [Planctomycetota bacterium]
MKTNLILFAIIASLTYVATLYFEGRKPNVVSAPVSPIETMKTQAAPDFEFMANNGKTYALSDFKGKTILLNFWASWCPPCIKELPLLMKAAQEQNVILIALSSDIDKASMDKFLKKQQLQSPHKNVFFAWDTNQNI